MIVFINKLDRERNNFVSIHYTKLYDYGDILITAEETDAAVEYWQLSLDRGNPSDTLKRKISERRMIHFV